MCFSAIYWAKINKIVFGANTKDSKSIGFNELMITDKKLKELGKSKIEIIEHCLRKDCLQLFTDWKKYNNKLY
jgi:tRNA(Arg) A34 adenosine deaminase TadA